MPDLAELDREGIEQALADLGEPRFHGRQVFQWIWSRGVTDFALMTDLSQPLRARLSDGVPISTPVDRDSPDVV